MDSEFYDFLMFELGEVIDEFETDNERVDEIMIILSASDGPIPETFYRLYTSGLAVDQDMVYKAMCYYSGIGELSVQCDCPPEDKYLCDLFEIEQSDYFEYGAGSVNKTKEWYTARMRVRSLRADLRG